MSDERQRDTPEPEVLGHQIKYTADKHVKSVVVGVKYWNQDHESSLDIEFSFGDGHHHDRDEVWFNSVDTGSTYFNPRTDLVPLFVAEQYLIDKVDVDIGGQRPIQERIDMAQETANKVDNE